SALPWNQRPARGWRKKWKRKSRQRSPSRRPASFRSLRNSCGMSSRRTTMTSRTQLAGRGSVLARRNLQTEIGYLKSPLTLSYVEAVREATDLEMARDPAVILFGLDVDDPKAIQGTTRGLLEKYGSERVFGTPLSEDAMTGAAIGMALAGLRPIHVHIRMEFLMLAMNQLIH